MIINNFQNVCKIVDVNIFLQINVLEEKEDVTPFPKQVYFVRWTIVAIFQASAEILADACCRYQARSSVRLSATFSTISKQNAH